MSVDQKEFEKLRFVLFLKMAKRKMSSLPNGTLAKRLKRLECKNRRPELKALARTNTAQTVNDSGAFVLLSDIDQGTSVSGRIGNVIQARKVEFMWAGSQGNNTVVRCVLFVDKDGDGTFPTLAELMHSVGTLSHVDSTRFNPENKERFRILKEVNITSTLENNAAGNASNMRSGKVEVKLNHQVHYAGSTGSSDFRRGNIFAVLWGNNATGDTYVTGQSISYTDV